MQIDPSLRNISLNSGHIKPRPLKKQDPGINTSDKMEKGFSSEEPDQSKKLAGLARKSKAGETGQSRGLSWKKAAGKAATLFMAATMLIGGLGLTGCTGGGEAPAKPETVIEQTVEEGVKQEANKDSGGVLGGILDRYLSEEGKQAVQDLTEQGKKAIENPSQAWQQAKEEATKMAEQAAKEGLEQLQEEGTKKAREFLEDGSEGVVEAAKDLANSDKENIQEKAGKLLEETKGYSQKKVDQATETADQVKEVATQTKDKAAQTAKDAKETKGESVLGLFRQLQEGYKKGMEQKQQPQNP